MAKIFTRKEMGIIKFAVLYLKANLDDARDGDLTKITYPEIENLQEKLKEMAI